MVFVFTGKPEESLSALISIFPTTAISFLIFLLNYWWFVPFFYYKNRRGIYVLVNFILYILIVLPSIFSWLHSERPDSENTFIFASTCFITLMFVVGSSALALALRNSLRNRILREQILEEKRQHTEDELKWLKNQINPHFLFNTLNNISALVKKNADQAQDCISRLSDLLRYAMYDTSKPYVPLLQEINFMKDYISLMKLRCNNKTTICENFEIESDCAKIAPLLLISFIENAFKHGVSSSYPSEINISLHEKNGVLTFICTNTNHAKCKSDRSGSGIGLVNMKRRFELLYPNNFEWFQRTDNDRFSIFIKILL